MEIRNLTSNHLGQIKSGKALTKGPRSFGPTPGWGLKAICSLRVKWPRVREETFLRLLDLEAQ